MPKARKRKLPIVTVESASNNSSTPLSSRTTIRRFHVLLKQRARLKASTINEESAKALTAIEDEFTQLGGLETYQRMSAIGQGTDRGGGSEKILIGWLKDAGLHKNRSCKLRLLDVGALKPGNYGACATWIDPTPLDLRSRHPSIIEQDFLQLDVAEHCNKWDIVSLSLVLNFVPEPKDRGMFHITSLLAALGFTQVRVKWKEGCKMAYWLYQKDAPSGLSLEIFGSKSILRQETIDTAQFAAVLDDIRNSWTDLPDGKKNGLVLFSGDVFSPSVESSITRGSHMVPVMNMLAPDVSLTGNHDFDFGEGYPHLSKLIQDTTFPWILSNIVDSDTSQVPECLHEYQIFNKAGIRIGVIGLVEKEWITTVATWPSTFIYKDMTETGLDLSRRLREEHQCDLIIALTHSRVPNDILLAKSLRAFSPSTQEVHPISSSHGVDIILGGHDHLYFVSKGVSSWEGYNLDEIVLGAEEDQGDVLIVKSGTDFRDLSELNLDLKDTPPGSVRRKIIKRITGKRHRILPEIKSSEPMQKLLKTLLSSVSDTMDAPVCKTATTIDCLSQFIRTAEVRLSVSLVLGTTRLLGPLDHHLQSAAGNLIADIIRHAYDEALCMKGCGGSDGVLICAGTLRGDSTYGPGIVTLGNILEILPFEDPTVVLELDGAAIWDALESSLSTWPAQEGQVRTRSSRRFPVISGFRVSWDSRREPGNRVLDVWTLLEKDEGISNPASLSGTTIPQLVDGEPITRDGKRTYKIVTREYMAQGHDGFLALKGKPYLVDDESGQLMSSIVRKYFLGSHFVNMMASRMSNSSNPQSCVDLQPRTEAAVSRETARRKVGKAHEEFAVAEHWKRAAKLVVQWWRRSRLHYRDQLSVCTTEHMSPVDAYDGQSIRRGEGRARKRWAFNEEDLITIHPEIDGRLKDIAR
ncbi:hypothetical protein C0995_001549 [Termitomyces sp. Mi166|nr:hypothetical protein C0995_001549 [Termitomyces sp. Mi166\